MVVVKENKNIETIHINNKNIAEIYYGNILVYSSVSEAVPQIVFRDIDENGNLTLATGSTDELFDGITTIGGFGLYYAFYNCTGITGSISFPKLTSVGSSGLFYAFYKCTGITSVSFPSLTTIEDRGLNYAFFGCTGITGSISFPSLTTMGNMALYYAFNNCTGITEIHFRADVKSTVEAQMGYSSKFGATNATIYFDL